ncbi:MAG: TraR/DksA family transcriptional regulator [Gammaproteobacteria bacterium]|jgi:DnaK suppressor protein|nr:TraR/DksA family transcriptional regulator [Gammaproteobacteria bacterium]
MDARKQKLIAMREALEDSAGTGDDPAAVVQLDQARVGRLSRMDALQAQAMAKASGQRRVAQLREIDAALRRIDEGSYGNCERCEEPVDPRRLDADPTARLCIDCASRSE